MPRRDLIFRVFVSSTFSDLIEERNELQKTTFPELRRYCQERGARFQAIDLRWGVSQEAALDQRTMNICIEELKRCQSLSPRPNFIVLLGNRYGWRPLPSEIEASEFEQILRNVPEADKSLLSTDNSVATWRDGQTNERIGWYRKDGNARPEIYVLQPRTILFPENASEEDKKRIRQDETHSWSVIEERMHEILLGSVNQFGWPTNDTRRFKYEASATHQEIRAGAMETEDPGAHVFCYFRDIGGLPSDKTASTYRDIKNNVVDADSEKLLKALKDELEKLLPPDHVHKHSASWKNNHPDYPISKLCEEIEKDLKTVIDREIAAFKQKPGLEREQDSHREFAEERCRNFVGRKEILSRIQSYIGSNNNRPLVIHGKSGSGKTALMAKAVSEVRNQQSEASSLIVSRFIGATPGSSDLRTLLVDVCREMGVTDIPQDMNELVRIFRAQLSTEQSVVKDEKPKQEAAVPKKIVLFLDALDQLNPADNARMLYWMPRELYPNVKIVISVLENSMQSEIPNAKYAIKDDPFDLARRIWPESLVELGALDETSGSVLLDVWLKESGRELRNEQKAEVFGKFGKCPLPLYLKLASEQARHWKSWEDASGKLRDSIEGLMEQMLLQLEQPGNHGEILVRHALAYIAAGKNGLTEDELLDVLSRKESGVLQDFAKRSPESPKVERLPVIIWSRLFADINRYMTQRRADGTIVMDFYHRQVGEAVRKRYLASEESRIQAHLHLSDYFDTLDFWAESLEAQRARAKRLPPTPRPANVRKVVELPYHRLEVAKLAGKNDAKSPHWDKVADLLTNWQFLEAKAEADPNAECGVQIAELKLKE